MPNPESQRGHEQKHQSDRYNIDKMREVFPRARNEGVGFDAGIHFGGSGWEEMVGDHLRSAGRKIWKSDESDSLRLEYTKYFQQTADGQFQYSYDQELRESVKEFTDDGLWKLRSLLQDMIYSQLKSDTWKKSGLNMGPKLAECQKELEDLDLSKAMRDFLSNTIEQLQSMDPEKDDYKEVFIILTVISMQAYDELSQLKIQSASDE